MKKSKNNIESPQQEQLEQGSRGVTPAECLKTIAHVAPFEIRSSKVINDGAANLVIEINNEWIFRFSRSELTKTQMSVENAFLPVFATESPIPIPSVEFSGEGFMGYKKMGGEPLRVELLATLSKEQQDKVARDLGLFLTSLHTFRFSHPDLREFPYGGADFWADIWPLVSPLLTQETRGAAKTYFETAFKEMNHQNSEKTLVHSDLGTSNILFDKTQNTIAGLIDFGDLCLRPRSRLQWNIEKSRPRFY